MAPKAALPDEGSQSAPPAPGPDEGAIARVRLTDEHIERLQRADASSDRRLAFLVFLATLAGNLIALVASLADATGLVVPVLDLTSPMPRLAIAGSTTILGPELRLVSAWSEAFQALHLDARELPFAGEVERKVRIGVEAVGTLRGIDLAAGGQVQLLAASEALNDADLQRLADAGVTIECAAPIGYDVIAFVTDITNRLARPLNRPELVGILDGSIRNWSEVGGARAPIRVFAREGSGTTDLVLRAYLGRPELPAHFLRCGSQSDCLNLTLSTPGSLYWVSSAWLLTQPSDYLRPVWIELDPGPNADTPGAQFIPSRYPPDLVRPLYMYVLRGEHLDARSTDLGVQYLSFVRGVAGQQILEAHHFYTYFEPPKGVVVRLPPGFGLRPDGPPVVCQ